MNEDDAIEQLSRNLYSIWDSGIPDWDSPAIAKALWDYGYRKQPDTHS